jgi:cystathionine beta-synthase
VMLPDSGRGYLSKIFNDDWLARLGLLWPSTSGPRVADLLADQPLPLIRSDDTLANAVKMMSALGVRYLLVADAAPPLRLAEVLGLVTEHSLASALVRGQTNLDDRVSDHLILAVPYVGVGEPLTAALSAAGGAGAVMALEGGLVRAALTTTDVLSYLASGSVVIPETAQPALRSDR